MSNKISGFTVVLDSSVSEEYMEKVRQSLLLLNGVIRVEGIIEDVSIFLGQSQERNFITSAIIDLVITDFGRKKNK